MTELIAFAGNRMIARGDAVDVALALKRALAGGDSEPALVFDAVTSRTVELDLRGSDAEIQARFTLQRDADRGARGRPKLGVVAREVTLLPRHWDWLAEQPGGASATIRRLVDEARRQGQSSQNQRLGKEALYRFMTVMAGNAPGYEEAIRAVFAEDRARFADEIRAWPSDVREQALTLSEAAFADTQSQPLSPTGPTP